MLRFFFANYPKQLSIYPDELRYFSIAQSIATGTGIRILNAPAAFQKILYSILISPAFYMPSRNMTISVIALINSIAVNFGIFPAYRMGKKITGRENEAILLALLYCFLPDITCTMTFMSETLFLPLSTLILERLIDVFDSTSNNRIINSIFTGILIYLDYMCKEIAAAILLSLIVYLVVYFFYCIVRKRVKINFELLKLIRLILIMTSVFVIIFITSKLTLFKGLGNSYHQQSMDALTKLDAGINFIYGFYYFAVCMFVVLLIFPMFLPLINIDILNSVNRRYYSYLMILSAVCMATISYTITIRENYLDTIPRIHFRYICFIWIPLLAIFFDSINKVNINDINEKKKIFITYTLLSLILILLLFNGIPSGYGFDNPILAYIRYLNAKQIIIMKWCLAALTMVIAILFLRDRKKAYILFVIFFAIQLTVSNFIQMHYYKGSESGSVYKGNCTLWDQQGHRNPTLEKLIHDSEKQFLIVSNSQVVDMQPATDLYLSGTNTYYIDVNSLLDTQGEEGIPLDGREFYSYFNHADLAIYRNLTQIDYIIVPKTLYIIPDNCKKLDIASDDFEIYENTIISYIPHISSLSDVGRHNITINGNTSKSDFMFHDGKVTSDKEGILIDIQNLMLQEGSYVVEVEYSYTGCKDDSIGWIAIGPEGTMNENVDDSVKKELSNIEVDGIKVNESPSSSLWKKTDLTIDKNAVKTEPYVMKIGGSIVSNGGDDVSIDINNRKSTGLMEIQIYANVSNVTINRVTLVTK